MALAGWGCFLLLERLEVLRCFPPLETWGAAWIVVYLVGLRWILTRL